MTDVRMPDGTIVRNVPDGITQTELQRRVAAHQDRYGGVSIGPDTSGLSPAESEQAMYKQVADEAAGVESQVPFFNRPSTSDLARKYGIPAVASLVVPGSGLPALLGQSAVAGAASGGVTLAQQSLDKQPLNYVEAAKDASLTAGGNLAGGLFLKGLGAAAKKLFVTPLTPEAQSAADYVRGSTAIQPFDNGTGGIGSELVDIPPKAPFPLSSAAPGSRGAAAQKASNLPLLGNLANQADSNRVVQFLNSQVGTLTPTAKPIEEAAIQGQQFLRSVLDPGETAFRQAFGAYRDTVGDLTEIPLTNTRAALDQAANALRERGETGALAKRIISVAKVDPESMSAQQLDDLYRGLLRDASKSGGGQAEMNKVLPAIAQDMNEVGKSFGLNFAGDIANANTVRTQYKDLLKIPQLQALSKDVKDPGKWFTTLFDPGNGKVLGKLRELNPQLYHDLADSYVASNIQRFNKPVKDGFGTALDGTALRAWYQQNADRLKLILGAPQAKAIDNFTNYAAHVNSSIERGVTGKSFDPVNALARLGVSGGSTAISPYIAALGEPGSFVLARGLSDPNSWLFKLFTKGVNPSTANFWLKSSQLAGQTAAQSSKPERDH
jgi:hypothetical protein